MGKRKHSSIKNDDAKLREALERNVIHVEDSIARIDNEIYHKELLRALPLKSLFERLSENEKKLARLIYVDRMSPREIAETLGEDVSETRWELNKLRAKIRARARSLLKKHEAENKLLLAWEQIYTKRNRLAS